MSVSSIVEYCIKRLMGKMKIEYVLLGLLAFFVVVAIYRYFKGKKGTYNNGYVMPPTYTHPVHTNMPATVTTTTSSSSSKDSKGETECRRVLEARFGKSFAKTRPDFMKNSVTGSNLELDCYNPQLKIACEYHGVQHYKYTPFYHRDKQHFYNQQYRDKETKELCAKNGILLIEVPYTVKIPDIEQYILQRLPK